MNNPLTTQLKSYGLLCGIFILSRLIPHPPSLTATIPLALLCASQQKSIWPCLVFVAANIITDLMLDQLKYHHSLGAWSLFTYSALIIIILSAHFRHSFKLNDCLGAGLFFWLWTNFGSWLLMPMYSKNIAGIVSCYTAALPFLANQLLGCLLWYTVIFYSALKLRLHLITNQ